MANRGFVGFAASVRQLGGVSSSILQGMEVQLLQMEVFCCNPVGLGKLWLQTSTIAAKTIIATKTKQTSLQQKLHNCHLTKCCCSIVGAGGAARIGTTGEIHPFQLSNHLLPREVLASLKFPALTP